MIKDIFSSLLVAVGIALAGFFIGYSILSVKQLDRSVTVRGLAEQTVKSDQAIWHIQFNSADDNLATVYQGMSDSQNKVKQFLLSQGFASADIQIDPVSITDNQSLSYHENENSKRYAAAGGVTLNTAQVDKVVAAQQQISNLVQQGVVLSNSNVTYLYNGLNAIKPAMLDQATANAKVAAQSFAKNSGSSLGSIRSASQGLFTITDANGQNYGSSSVMKVVRVVTSVEYLLQ